MKLKITTIGHSAGVILPRELPARLRLEKDDELFAQPPDGIRLTTCDPTLARQMEVAEEVMRKDRNGLRNNSPGCVRCSTSGIIACACEPAARLSQWLGNPHAGAHPLSAWPIASATTRAVTCRPTG